METLKIEKGQKIPIHFAWDIKEAEILEVIGGTVVRYRIAFDDYRIGTFAKLIGYYYERAENLELFKERIID